MNKTMLKLGLVLALFAGVACAGLAVVHSLTEETIAAHQKEDLDAALAEIFPEADGFDVITSSLSSADERVSIADAYAMKKGSALLGIAVQAKGPSYGGDATLLSGFSPDKKVVRVVILDLKDTPGLGANAANPSYFVDRPKKITFPGQFAGKLLSDGFEVKKDVQAITASTITSRSLTAIVKASGDAAAAYLAKGGAK
ncbi:MAG: FMN-binding protein [Spirochaetales bacterium]|jgi:electron transport complex protein RnfG|nr:FMN-binding protein [Spirochaetales bacterium]